MLGGTRVTFGAIATLTAALTLSACVAAEPATEDGVPVVRWWTVPGHGDLGGIVEACNSEYDGAFAIEVHELPQAAVERRSMLLRRLVAEDPHLDVVSLDTEITPEFARAGLVREVSGQRAETVRETAYPEAVTTAEDEGRLFAVPFLWEPQLLWYRPSVAERAGLDMSRPLAWEDLIAAAERAQSSVVMDDPDGRVLMRWVTAVVAGTGARVLSGPEPDATVAVGGAPGETAVALMIDYLASPAGAEPADDVAARFASTHGGFALAGPSFIAHPAVQAVATDLAWAPFPTLVAGAAEGDDTEEAEDVDDPVRAVPVSGVNLAVARGSRLPEAATLAVDCLTAPRLAEVLVSDTGHALAYPGVLADTLDEAYPLTEVITDSLADGAAATVSPWWSALDEAIVEIWQPLDALDDTVAERSWQRAGDLMRGEGL